MKDVGRLNAMEWVFLITITLAWAVLIGLWWIGVWPLDRFYRAH